MVAKHLKDRAYYKHANRQVKRIDKTLPSRLRRYVSENQQDCDMCAMPATYVWSSQVHCATWGFLTRFIAASLWFYYMQGSSALLTTATVTIFPYAFGAWLLKLLSTRHGHQQADGNCKNALQKRAQIQYSPCIRAITCWRQFVHQSFFNNIIGRRVIVNLVVQRIYVHQNESIRIRQIFVRPNSRLWKWLLNNVSVQRSPLGPIPEYHLVRCYQSQHWLERGTNDWQ